MSRVFHLYRSDTKRNENNTRYPYAVEIRSKEDLKSVVVFDHVSAHCKDNHRKTEKFIDCDCILADFDNTHTDIQSNWVTPERVAELFQDVELYIVPSKSNMIEKDGKAPRPKFHVYFPVETITSTAAVKSLMHFVIGFTRTADEKVNDCVRFFYATTPSVTVTHWDGALTIADFAAAHSAPAANTQDRRIQETMIDHDFLRNNIDDMLSFIPSDDRNTWRNVGMALKYEGFDVDLWDRWSQTTRSGNYPGYGEIQKQWRSFRDDKPNGIHGGTLVELAKQYGWKCMHPTESYTAKKVQAQPNEQGAQRQKKERFTWATLESILSSEQISIRYNLLSNRIVIEQRNKTIPAQDLDTLTTYIFDRYAAGYTACTKVNIRDDIAYIAQKHQFNPVIDYLKSLKWDGKKRFDELLDIMRIAADDTLSRVLIHKWLLQTIAILYNPDISESSEEPFGIDGVLTLQGDQGWGKTLFFSKLAIRNDWFLEGGRLDPHDKDKEIRATSTWITELGELETTLRSDMEYVKSFLTASYDKIRRPYGHEDLCRPRHTSLCATCNNNKFLIDPTGNRRFWTVILTERMDIQRLQNFDFGMLWAEYYAAFIAKYNAGGLKGINTLFRLTTDEQDMLAERNKLHDKGIKGEDEVRDILAEAHDNQSEWVTRTLTISQWRSTYSVNRVFLSSHISNEQIGRVLSKLKIPKSRKRSERYYNLPVRKSEAMVLRLNDEESNPVDDWMEIG